MKIEMQPMMFSDRTILCTSSQSTLNCFFFWIYRFFWEDCILDGIHHHFHFQELSIYLWNFKNTLLMNWSLQGKTTTNSSFLQSHMETSCLLLLFWRFQIWNSCFLPQLWVKKHHMKIWYKKGQILLSWNYNFFQTT